MTTRNSVAFRKQLIDSMRILDLSDTAVSDAEIEEMVTLHERGFTDDQIIEFICLGLTGDDIPPVETH